MLSRICKNVKYVTEKAASYRQSFMIGRPFPVLKTNFFLRHPDPTTIIHLTNPSFKIAFFLIVIWLHFLSCNTDFESQQRQEDFWKVCLCFHETVFRCKQFASFWINPHLSCRSFLPLPISEQVAPNQRLPSVHPPPNPRPNLQFLHRPVQSMPLHTTCIYCEPVTHLPDL